MAPLMREIKVIAPSFKEMVEKIYEKIDRIEEQEGLTIFGKPTIEWSHDAEGCYFAEAIAYFSKP